jgi:hypothetical protein
MGKQISLAGWTSSDCPLSATNNSNNVGTHKADVRLLVAAAETNMHWLAK